MFRRRERGCGVSESRGSQASAHSHSAGNGFGLSCLALRTFQMLLAVHALTALTPSQATSAGEIDKKEPRIWSAVRIGRAEVRLAVDTGTSYPLALFSPASERLGLRLSDRVIKSDPKRGIPPGRWTEGYGVTHAGRTAETPLLVIDLSEPPSMHGRFDGVLGWQWLRGNVLHFDWSDSKVKILSAVPREAREWSSWRISAAHETLVVSVPICGTAEVKVLIDTGDTGGLTVGRELWATILGEASSPVTFRPKFALHHGLIASPLAKSGKICIGGAMIDKLLLERAEYRLPYEGITAHLGLLALSRFHVYVDGAAGWVYIKPRPQYAWTQTYNRMGALFMPKDFRLGEPVRGPLVARVARGSPAFESGIRDGDVLRRVDGKEVEALLRTRGGLNVLWDARPGTEYRIEIERNGEFLEVDVVLRELLSIGR